MNAPDRKAAPSLPGFDARVRNRPPALSGGMVLPRLRIIGQIGNSSDVVGKCAEEFNAEGDHDPVVFIGPCEAQANEPIPGVVQEGADINVLASARRNDDFLGHSASPPADLGGASLAGALGESSAFPWHQFAAGTIVALIFLAMFVAAMAVPA